MKKRYKKTIEANDKKLILNDKNRTFLRKRKRKKTVKQNDRIKKMMMEVKMTKIFNDNRSE